MEGKTEVKIISMTKFEQKKKEKCEITKQMLYKICKMNYPFANIWQQVASEIPKICSFLPKKIIGMPSATSRCVGDNR